MEIKGLIFDYGGTIDSGGEHWSEVIYRGWQHAGIKMNKEIFREAYVYAERELACVRHIEPEDDFLQLLRKKMRVELQWLRDNGYWENKYGDYRDKAEVIAEYCNVSARQWVEHARPVLEQLAREYPMVLVSNFYGNVNAVLKSYDLQKYFKAVVESAVVGVRKPDPQIFTLGVEALATEVPGLKAEDVVVVGDSQKKDIQPGLKAGCRAVWIKGKGWTAEEDATAYSCTISDLTELPAILQQL